MQSAKRGDSDCRHDPASRSGHSGQGEFKEHSGRISDRKGHSCDKRDTNPSDQEPA